MELVRAQVLAGNELPKVWIPDAQTRDDRELVRMRLEAAEKQARVKAQIKSLLKRNNLRRPPQSGRGWTSSYQRWLRGLAKQEEQSPLRPGARAALASLLRQRESLEQEISQLQQQVLELALSERYCAAFYELLKLKGVGPLTAMVFLTEVGDLRRFQNRKQIAAYLGLVPSSNESGQAVDRKGHITRQGPGRVRKVLCQATWSRVTTDEQEKEVYQRIVQRNPKHKKIAVVAGMRRLAVRMWHRAAAAPAEAASASAPARQKGLPRTPGK